MDDRSGPHRFSLGSWLWRLHFTEDSRVPYLDATLAIWGLFSGRCSQDPKKTDEVSCSIVKVDARMLDMPSWYALHLSVSRDLVARKRCGRHLAGLVVYVVGDLNI